MISRSPLWLIGVGIRLPYGGLKPGKKSSCFAKFKVQGSRSRARADMNFSKFTGGPKAHEELF
jgi:hypothetical protein